VTRTAITDWRVHDENDLPDIAPGEDYERVITPQTFVVLRRILVRDFIPIRLSIAAIVEVPFELAKADGRLRTYRPVCIDEELRGACNRVGLTIRGPDAIAIVPGMDVRIFLRNARTHPAKPRVTLIGDEEAPR
jgi:hypothetical protein